MYSFDMVDDQYKYESIQYGYELEYEDESDDDLEISLEEMIELSDEILEMEEAF